MDMEAKELMDALAGDAQANTFFETLADGYKRRYHEWVARGKSAAERASRAQHALRQLQRGQKTLKIGSYMGDVGIIQKIDDIPSLKAELIALCEEKSHPAVSTYALLLAEHVLQMTGTPRDAAIEACFAVNQRWQAGQAGFQEARDVAGGMFQLARAEGNPVKTKVLRILGQVAATPHVKRHALIASDYAVTLINTLHPQDLEAVRMERLLQIQLIQSV